jgi:hypothetical protein
MTTEQVLVEAAYRDYGHVADRFDAARAEAATLDALWLDLRGLAPDADRMEAFP